MPIEEESASTLYVDSSITFSNNKYYFKKWPDLTLVVSVILEKGKFAGMLSSIDKSYSRYYSQVFNELM